MTCRCITLVNKTIAEHNAELVTSFEFDVAAGKVTTVMCLPTRKIDSKIRKRLPSFAMTYCPVCGVKLIKDGKRTKGKQ